MPDVTPCHRVLTVYRVSADAIAPSQARSVMTALASPWPGMQAMASAASRVWRVCSTALTMRLLWELLPARLKGRAQEMLCSAGLHFSAACS